LRNCEDFKNIVNNLRKEE